MKKPRKKLDAIFILIMFAIGIAWAALQWKECRSMQHSLLYCVQHIG